MKSPHDHENRIAAEAARWQRLLETATSQELAEFADWIKASPRHLSEFLFMEALDSAVSTANPQLIAEYVADTAVSESTVVPFPSPESSTGSTDPRDPPHDTYRRSATARPQRLIAAVASLALLAIGLFGWDYLSTVGHSETYATAIGEQRTITLEDGSIVQLNTQSRIRAHLTRASRKIVLEAGEVLFDVAPDASRPFTVSTSVANFEALGTLFNIDRRETQTTISVIEGTVEVTQNGLHRARPLSRTDGHAALVVSGEVMHVDVNGNIVADTGCDARTALMWRQRRLVFRAESLENIALEFNRYNRSPQLLIKSESLRARQFGGTFDADDPESFVRFVAMKGDVIVHLSGDEWILEQREQGELHSDR